MKSVAVSSLVALLLLATPVTALFESLTRQESSSSTTPFLGAVTGLHLIDSVTNDKITDLTDGMIVNVRALGADPEKLNIVAVTEGDVSRVQFGFNGNADFRSETSAPFSMCGDDGNGDFFICQSLGLGLFQMSATPLETVDGEATGVAGTGLDITFELVESMPVCETMWTDFIVGVHYIDEEMEEIDCGAPSSLITGMQCIDNYCDDIRLLCKTCENCVYEESSSYVTDVFSEEGEAMLCDDDHFMTGLSCEGHYCDNLTMECTANVGRTAGTDCEWSDWMSEEDNDGTVEFDDAYVRGIECRGHYCDDKRFWICPVVETC